MADDLSAKLDILIRLQAAALISPFDSAKEKILFLHRAGLRPSLIADIVGKSQHQVNVTVSKERKSSKKGNQDDE